MTVIYILGMFDIFFRVSMWRVLANANLKVDESARVTVEVEEVTCIVEC
jgi:hypothetical protein